METLDRKKRRLIVIMIIVTIFMLLFDVGPYEVDTYAYGDVAFQVAYVSEIKGISVFLRNNELFHIPVPLFADIVVPVILRLYYLVRIVMLIFTPIYAFWEKLSGIEHRKIHTVCLSLLIFLAVFVYMPWLSSFKDPLGSIIFALQKILPVSVIVYFSILRWRLGGTYTPKERPSRELYTLDRKQIIMICAMAGLTLIMFLITPSPYYSGSYMNDYNDYRLDNVRVGSDDIYDGIRFDLAGTSFPVLVIPMDSSSVDLAIHIYSVVRVLLLIVTLLYISRSMYSVVGLGLRKILSVLFLMLLTVTVFKLDHVTEVINDEEMQYYLSLGKETIWLFSDKAACKRFFALRSVLRMVLPVSTIIYILRIVVYSLKVKYRSAGDGYIG